MKVKREAGYFDGYTDEDSGKVGSVVHGSDVILLDAPEVRLSPDTPLLTEAQDIAGAINELFQLDPGGGDEWQRPSDWPLLGEPAANESILLIRNFSGTAISYQMCVTPNIDDDPTENLSNGDNLIISWNGNTANITTNYNYIDCNIGSSEYCIVSVKCTTDGYLVLDSGSGDSYYDVIDAHIGADVKLNYKAFLKAKLHHVKLFGWQPQAEFNYGSVTTNG